MLTFSLIIALWYPTDGYTQIFEVGAKLTFEQCERAKVRTIYQLQQTLSTAELLVVECRANREI